MRARAFVLAVGLFAACKGGDGPAADAAPATQREDRTAAVPKTEAGFLAELAPLPDGVSAIEVRYRITQITGSALSGEMTVVVAAGGNRREQWELRAGPED